MTTPLDSYASPWTFSVVGPCRTRLKEGIVAALQVSGCSSELQLGDAKPAVLLIVGVNGGGKTTTIGKLAHKFGNEGAKVGSPHGTSLL
jgi:signal recognition particle GTPase